MDADDEALATRLLRYRSDLEFMPGERMGSERQLAEQFGVARSAMRRALDLLERSGAIRRAMGGAGGIFADDGRVDRHLDTVEGTPALLRRQGFALETQVLEVKVGRPSPREQRILQLEEDANVYRLKRKRLANGSPFSVDASVFPAQLLPGFTAHDLSGSVYDLLAKEYDLHPGKADERVEVVAGTDDDCDLLEVARGSAVLQLVRVMTVESGAVVELGRDALRADRIRFHRQRYGANWRGPVPSDLA